MQSVAAANVIGLPRICRIERQETRDLADEQDHGGRRDPLDLRALEGGPTSPADDEGRDRGDQQPHEDDVSDLTHEVAREARDTQRVVDRWERRQGTRPQAETDERRDHADGRDPPEPSPARTGEPSIREHQQDQGDQDEARGIACRGERRRDGDGRCRRADAHQQVDREVGREDKGESETQGPDHIVRTSGRQQPAHRGEYHDDRHEQEVDDAVRRADREGRDDRRDGDDDSRGSGQADDQRADHAVAPRRIQTAVMVGSTAWFAAITSSRSRPASSTSSRSRAANPSTTRCAS